MKEIDFLPDWYRSNRRRQISCRTQYIVLSGVFIILITWGFGTAHSVSCAQARFKQMDPERLQAEGVLQEYDRISNRVTLLQEKADILQQLSSKIDVAAVLAEIGFLVDQRIVLTRVDLRAEKFPESYAKQLFGGSAVKPAGAGSKSASLKSFGSVRFKAVISGIAADAGDVAELICRFEDSPYFCQVIPSFSRNKQLDAQPALTKEAHQVSEFKISCYLANYHIKDGSVKKVANKKFGA